MNLSQHEAGATVIPFPAFTRPALAEPPISCAELSPELMDAVFRDQESRELLDLVREMIILAEGPDVPFCSRQVRLVAAFKALGIVLHRELPELMEARS